MEEIRNNRDAPFQLRLLCRFTSEQGVEAGATIADIQTTAATEQLLPLNPANRRIRTRMYGGVGGEEP